MAEDLGSEQDDVISNDATPENEEEPEVHKYIVFRKDRMWAMFQGTRFEVHQTGRVLFYMGDELVGVGGNDYIDVMKKEDIDKACLLNWGIEKPPPFVDGKFVVRSDGKKLSAWDLLSQRKVAWDDLEQTSDGWRVVIFDVAQDKEILVGEFDDLETAVIEVYKATHKEVKDKTPEKITNEPAENKDDWKPASEGIAVDSRLRPVWLKYADNEVDEGWLRQGDLLVDNFFFFKVKPPKPVIAWKPRNIYPPMGPK